MNLNRRVILLLFFFSLATGAYSGNLSRIQKAIRKDKFEKAEALIQKSLLKDTLNAGARYFLSILYSDTAYYRFNIDSARICINAAFEDYEATPIEELKDLRKVDLTKFDFTKQLSFVTLLAFDRAYEVMTLEIFQQFLDNYPDASLNYAQQATFIRDSLAYDIAMEQNTWQDYENYFETYPRSSFSPDARKRYQVLIFRDYTKDDRLESYIRFLEEHPDTPFRKEAEAIIFQRSTIDHQWSSYLHFLKRYPETHLRKKTVDILYYILRDSDGYDLEYLLDLHPNPDSLRAVSRLAKHSLFPILENGQFGFLNLEGQSVIDPYFSSISQAYLCGNLLDEWLVGEAQNQRVAIARNGEVILRGLVDIEEVGISAVLVLDLEKTLFHKSGFRIMERPVDNARELFNGWIAIEEDGKWGIVTQSGYEVVATDAEEISTQGNFLIFEKEGRFAITTPDHLQSSANQLQYQFDDYEVISDTLVQGFDGKRECLLDRTLNYLMPLEEQSIYVTDAFWYKKDAAGYQIFDVRDEELIQTTFEAFEVNEGWLTLKKDKRWMLISRRSNLQPLSDLDSVKLINGSAAFYSRGDSLQIIFQNGKREWLQKDEKVCVLAQNSQSSLEYLLFESRNYQKVLDSDGEFQFESKYQSISVLSDTLFKFKQRDKIGVITRGGKQIIAAKYDVIDQQDEMIFLLDGKRIGGYDLGDAVLVTPKYEARIRKIAGYYQVQEKGKVGLVDPAGKTILPAEFDEFTHWNDSSLWARADGRWQLLATDGTPLLKDVLSLDFWLQKGAESFALILQKDGYGLLSNEKGTILESEYNDILNLGTLQTPVIFAEQHLKAAAFFVVTYFDVTGGVIRSQAFRPEEYDLIYCDSQR